MRQTGFYQVFRAFEPRLGGVAGRAEIEGCDQARGASGTAPRVRKQARAVGQEAQWPAGWGVGPPGVAFGSGPLAASASL